MTLGVLIGLLVAGIIAVPVVWLVVRHQVDRARRAERHALANERLAEIGAMTRGLAHEIRNPLSTIGLNAQLLGEGVGDAVADPEERSRLLRRVESVRREADRLKGILEDFLRYAGAVHIEPAPRDLNEIVDEMVDFFLPQAQHHGIRLRADPSPHPLPVAVDANLFKQALLNLLMNAVQAMSPEGPSPNGMPIIGRELILRTEPAQLNEPTTGAGVPRSSRAPRDTDACAVHVIDTGPGMTPEQAERIFQPYFTTKPGGSGLGLPTARRLIEAHSGTITVHTEPGIGTDFVIVLPRRGSAPAGTGATDAAPGAERPAPL
ncbi:MAG: two-component system sensor histidine kinase NtrB [Phycisphaerales bacterium]